MRSPLRPCDDARFDLPFGCRATTHLSDALFSGLNHCLASGQGRTTAPRGIAVAHSVGRRNLGMDMLKGNAQYLSGH